MAQIRDTLRRRRQFVSGGASFVWEAIMVDAVIFIPGAGGSTLELPNGDIVWPPTAEEYLFTGYERIQQFIDPTLQAKQIVDTVPLHTLFLSYWVYEPVLLDLDLINAQFPNILIDRFPYDFRKSALDAAKLLQAEVETLHNAGKNSIALVCHSTGNLVARALLENTSWQSQPWFASLSLYLGVCGPHLGVPEVLQYVLGNESWISIMPDDMKTFTKNPNYPGAYELLPFRPQNVQYDTLNDVNTGPQDFYDPAIASEFGLDWNNLGQALILQGALSFAKKPAGVKYRLVAGQGQPTEEHINYQGAAYQNAGQDNAGDGTNPLWTTSPNTTTPATILVGDHFGVMNTSAFRNILWTELTGGPAPFVLEEVARVVISLDQHIYRPGEEVSILLIPDAPTKSISAQIEFSKVHLTRSEIIVESTTPFVYSGPEIKYITARMMAPTEPGVYRLALVGKTHATDPKFAPKFAVNADLPGRKRR